MTFQLQRLRSAKYYAEIRCIALYRSLLGLFPDPLSRVSWPYWVTPRHTSVRIAGNRRRLHNVIATPNCTVLALKFWGFFLICIVGGGVQTGSTRHVGHLLAYCTCPGATLSTTNPTWPDQGLNPGRRGGKPATNRFSYGAALEKFPSRYSPQGGRHHLMAANEEELLANNIRVITPRTMWWAVHREMCQFKTSGA
jgi:hypothetical protein